MYLGVTFFGRQAISIRKSYIIKNLISLKYGAHYFLTDSVLMPPLPCAVCAFPISAAWAREGRSVAMFVAQY